MLYVTDTHALVWYILEELPNRADVIFKSAERGESTMFVPMIVLAECLYLVEDGKIELDFDESHVTYHCRKMRSYKDLDVGKRVWIWWIAFIKLL